MKRVLFAAALLGALVGCKQEAERFGYKGSDLAEAEMDFFSTGPGVTNWVPARVLNVYEKYEFTEDENRLVSAAGVVSPNDTLDAIPEGYVAAVTEPWFTTFEKKCENLGFAGKSVFIGHRGDDGKWRTAESSFSSYWPTKDEALAAMAKMRAKLEAEFGPKKFYDFADCFAAEYVRLRVLVIVGQKADGTWACMLGIQDKCRTGCGSWLPVEEQQARVDRENYRKAMAVWQAKQEEALLANHAIVEKLRQEKGIAGFEATDGRAWTMSDDGRYARVATGSQEIAEADFTTNAVTVAWETLVNRVKTVSGVDLSSVEPKLGSEYGYEIRQAQAGNGLYEVVALLAVPQEAVVARPEEGKEKGAATFVLQWQVCCFENLQACVELPVRPTLPQ